jgi:hypothetical protein
MITARAIATRWRHRRLVRPVVSAPQADRVQASRAPATLRPRDAGEQHRQLDVGLRGEPRQQVEELEHETDVLLAHGGALGLRHLLDRAAPEGVVPAVGRSRQPITLSSVDLPDPEGPATAR